MNERFSEIRKHLNLTTRKFGEKLNITGGAVTNMEKGKRNLTDRVISDVCREFNVNEEWLRSGTGEMFTKDNFFSLDELIAKKGCNELESRIIRAYFSIPKEIREQLMDHFEDTILPALNGNDEITATKQVAATKRDTTDI